MPIYEYRCQHCQHELEIIQKMSDEALIHCPVCGKDSLTKLISRSSFQLKGSGWYQTDFKNPSQSSATTPVAESKTETTTATNTETATGSKPATTTEEAA